MGNTYYDKIKFVERKIDTYLKEIFKVYGNELLLKLEDYNLLTNNNNCIQTSTALGFIMEEFITSKLEIYTFYHKGDNEIKIEKIKGKSTVNTSYDCYINYGNIFFMVNIKVEKQGVSNNAISAINILHRDYVEQNSEIEKSFIIIKTQYKLGTSEKDNQKKILITGIDSYCLEEIDFTNGHRQDHRNWSQTFNSNSGRLNVSIADRKKNILSEDKISHKLTKKFIDDIYNGIN